jgi:hypothetical protein
VAPTDDYTLPDWSWDPEDQSIVRPSDVTLYEHGKPSPFGDRTAELHAESVKAEDDAFTMLRESMNKQAEVSPSQGMAAALLAAIPTLGGYLIGNSVGRPNIPAGITGFDATKYQTGGYAGGLAGAKIGMEASGGYLGALDADQAQKNDVYQKMAQIQANRAVRLGNKEDAVALSGMQNQAQDARQEDSQKFQRENIGLEEASAIRRDKARERQPTTSTVYDLLTPEQKLAKAAEFSGVDATGKPLPAVKKPFTLSASDETQMGKSNAFIQSSLGLADQLSNYKSWAEYNATKAGTVFDEGAIQSLLLNNNDNLIRMRTGAAMNNQEDVIYKRMLQGDISAGPQAIANILRKLSIAEATNNQSKIEVAKRASDPEALNALFGDAITRANTVPGMKTKAQLLAEARARRGLK